MVKCWSNSQNAREALEAGISNLARMTAFDMQLGGPQVHVYDRAPSETDPMRVRVSFRERGSSIIYPPMPMAGYVISRNGPHVWVRVPSGELHSVAEANR
jgi:hypothetical protein